MCYILLYDAIPDCQKGLWYSNLQIFSQKTESWHDANFVITGGTTGYGANSDDKVGIITTLNVQWLQTGPISHGK